MANRHMTTQPFYVAMAANNEKPKWQEEVSRDMQAGSTSNTREGGGRKGMQRVRTMRSEAPTEVSTIEAGHISDSEAALRFILGGNATFTLRSKATGTRYTYKVRKAEDRPTPTWSGIPMGGPTWFVSLLNGPDNEGDFTYLGIVRDNQFKLTRKSRMTMQSKPVVAFAWMFDKLVKHAMPKDAEIWHAGRCGRCGRKLTVPESISTGFGPECAGKLEEAF